MTFLTHALHAIHVPLAHAHDNLSNFDVNIMILEYITCNNNNVIIMIVIIAIVIMMNR
jgi:hypothetical protein